MKNKTLLIFLVISVIFNIAFLGNYIYHRYFLFPKYRYNKIPAPKFEKLVLMRRNIRKYHLNYIKERREFLQMLQSPNVNEDELRKKLDTTLKKEMEMERKIGESFIKLRSQMTNREARIFFRNYLRKRINRKRRIKP